MTQSYGLPGQLTEEHRRPRFELTLRRSLLAGVLAAGAWACAPARSSETPEPAAKENSPQHTKKDPEKAGPLRMPPGKEVSFREAMDHVIRVRGLAELGPVRGLRVDPDDLLAHVERAVDLETPAHALRGTEAMLVGLGLVPRDFQYRRTMLRLLSEKLAGLYDPHLKTMMIREDLGEVDQQMTLLHELVHALQDQHFELEEIVAWSPDDTDRSGALSALAEGDATSAMFDGMMQEGKTALSFPTGFFQERMADEAGDLPGVPPIIARSLKAPYVDGLTFVHALRRRGGWKEVDRVWQTPPQTTEQVLHLDKFDAKEPAVNVEVPGSPAGNAKLLLHDVWGEQNLRMALEEWLPEDKAESAAAGWGGDRIAAFEKDGRTLVGWHLVMDSEDDARELEAALIGALEGREPDERCAFFGNSGAVWHVDRTARTVALHSLRDPADEPALESACTLLTGWSETQFGPE